ncbi:hypothetical protein DNTS_009557 [Danionella cerebrum]|uniref:Uncharacterized protein n=1 Tax=Danionella cerebrum TaxID=2873325 RepID=A0A553N0Z6_9TELE|nr:hypothetical protein DNTS_009557 [Danionella translucida]
MKEPRSSPSIYPQKPLCRTPPNSARSSENFGSGDEEEIGGDVEACLSSRQFTAANRAKGQSHPCVVPPLSHPPPPARHRTLRRGRFAAVYGSRIIVTERHGIMSWRTNEGAKHMITMLWVAVNVFLFWRTFLLFYSGEQYFYLHKMLGLGLCFSRASASVLNLNCSLVLMPMCRSLLTILRGSQQVHSFTSQMPV